MGSFASIGVVADTRSQAEGAAKPEPLPQGTATRAVGFIGNPARSEADANLRAVFMEAKAMTVRVGNDLAGWQDPADDMGFAVNTVRKIEMASRGHFAGGCSLLFEDWLAYGAENHLKSLLDSYAHVAWILGRGGLAPPMTPSGRARCYELGMVNALREEVGLLDTLISNCYRALRLRRALSRPTRCS
jgi:hypothetical protein